MKYVPFLKMKQNEIIGFRHLSNGRRKHVIPLFDVPRKNDIDEDEFKSQVRKGLRYITLAHQRFHFPFYLDVFDIPDTIFPDGKHIYEYTLEQFKDFNVFPVVGLDRHEDHISAAQNFINTNHNHKYFAIRLTDEDIVSYMLTKNNIDEMLSEIIDDCDSCDLIVDLRLIFYDEIDDKFEKIDKVLQGLLKSYFFRNIIISSSTIPPQISELVDVASSESYQRNEWILWQKLIKSGKEYCQKLIYGDYTVVTPEFTETEMDPRLISARQTPRIYYTLPDTFFVTRGKALRTSGYDQYYDLAKEVESLSYYRGRGYCHGDQYIHDVSNRVQNSCGSAGSWIANTINCHLSVMIDSL